MRSASFRVAKVSRPLMCVADMVDKGQTIVFTRGRDGRDASYMLDGGTGVQTAIDRRNKVYEIPFHVDLDRSLKSKSDFPRQRQA